MISRRATVLMLGPVPIVLGSMSLSEWMRPAAPTRPASNQVIVRGQNPDLLVWQAAPTEAIQEAPPTRRTETAEPSLEQACQQAAKELADRLGTACPVLVRSPFVIAGDLSEAQLDLWHRQTIGPAARAMANRYFRTAPNEPITVLLFSGDQTYNRYALQLFGDEGISVYGYYKPGLRTLVMNIGTGGGTLVHELTHALMDFDFPDVPAWFNEGLASLHEQCHIREDESGIEGLVNWRLEALQQAIATDKLRTLRSMIGDDDFRGRQVNLNYAQARYFCFYLQQRGALADFYQRLRSNQAVDRLGLAAVSQTFPNQGWEDIEAGFRQWVLGLTP